MKMKKVTLNRNGQTHAKVRETSDLKAECLNISNAKGALLRALNTLKRQSAVLAKYNDKSDKPGDSGMLIDASLKCFGSAAYWLDQGIDVLESALKYAKEGK